MLIYLDEHDLVVEGTQFYAILDAQKGKQSRRPIFDAPTGQNAGQAVTTSGGVSEPRAGYGNTKSVYVLKLYNLHRESLMAYKLNKTDGTLLVDLIDGTIDVNSTSYISR